MCVNLCWWRYNNRSEIKFGTNLTREWEMNNMAREQKDGKGTKGMCGWLISGEAKNCIRKAVFYFSFFFIIIMFYFEFMIWNYKLWFPKQNCEWCLISVSVWCFSKMRIHCACTAQKKKLAFAFENCVNCNQKFDIECNQNAIIRRH